MSIKIYYHEALVVTNKGFFCYTITSDKKILLNAVLGYVSTEDIIEAHKQIKERIV